MSVNGTSISLGGKWLALDDENRKLKLIVAHLNNEILGLKKAYANDIELIEANRSALNQAEMSMESMKAESANLKTALNEERKTRIDREAVIEAQLGEIQRLTAEGLDFQRRSADDGRKIESLERTLVDKEGSIEAKSHEVHALKAALKQEEERMREVYSEWQLQKDKIEKLEFALRMKREQCGKLIKEKNGLKDMIGWKKAWEKENPGKKREMEREEKQAEMEDNENEEQNEEEKAAIERANQENTATKEFDQAAAAVAAANEATAFSASEEARYYRSTIIRQKRHIELLEEKVKELDSQVRILKKDNHTLAIRFKGATDYRVKVEKEKKKIEALASGAAAQQTGIPIPMLAAQQ